MKLKFLIIAFTFISGIINANTNIDLRNRTPFEESNNTFGPKIEYHKFGEKRNINVKSASYNHYNQKGHKQSIINQNTTPVNRTQSVTLQNTQFNYGNQNSGRKNSETTVASMRYNTPMQIDQYRDRSNSLSSTVASNNITIETGLTQHIVVDTENSETDTPDDSTEDVPLTDAIPFMLFLASIYYTVLRYKK